MQREQGRTHLVQGFRRAQGCCSQEYQCTKNINEPSYYQAPTGRIEAQIQQLTGTAALDRQNT